MIRQSFQSSRNDRSMLGATQTDFDFDRRQFQRVKVLLNGRLMLSDHSEFQCRVADISPGNVSLSTVGAGRIGERVIAYIDHIGRLEGTVSRVTPDGFALELCNTARKKAKLVTQLTWLANKHELNLPEDRRYERVTPRNGNGILSFEDGRQYRCNIIDLSLSGAALEINARPPIGTQVSLGGIRGQVARHFGNGIAIEFVFVQRRHNLKRYLG